MSGLRKELARTSNRFDTTWYTVNNLRNMTDKRNALSNHCQFCDLSIIRVSRSFSMINALHDPNCKYNYVSTVGVVMTRQIQRRLDKKTYKGTSYSLFSFFMALFCQSFKNEFKFNMEPTDHMESVDGIGRFRYESNFDICGDGSLILRQRSYDADIVRKPNFLHEESKLTDVYRSPIVDICVNMNKESNGYYPHMKGFYAEHVMYEQYSNGHEYEGRGIKHLHECHHGCNGSGYCDKFCKGRLIQANHKQNDMFQLENEEMVCTDCPVNYDKLSELYIERATIDQNQKLHSYSTLIRPPCIEGVKGTCVFITEINADLSCDFVSPHTIQDPVYVNYDKDTLQVRSSEPLLSLKDPSYVRQKWHRQALLTSLNSVMKDYGCVESTQCFSTFKYNLLSVCNASSDVFYHGDSLFYENFLSDIVVHCLRHAMKSINDELIWLCGQCQFRPIFSPSMLSMMKILNTLRRAFDLKDELTSFDLMNERTGSIVGALIQECKDLLDRADASMVSMRCNHGKGFRLGDAFKGD